MRIYPNRSLGERGEQPIPAHVLRNEAPPEGPSSNPRKRPADAAILPLEDRVVWQRYLLVVEELPQDLAHGARGPAANRRQRLGQKVLCELDGVACK